MALVVACGGSNEPNPGEPLAGGGGTSAGEGSAGEPNRGGSTASPAGGNGSTDPCECDDGIACTKDECVDDECQHQPLHFECPIGQFCSTEAGCAKGEACANDEDCDRPDACLLVTCDDSSRTCIYWPLDGDTDGAPPQSCGGPDCDDDDPVVRGAGHAEVCDGKDNDCDGVTDPVDDSGCAEGRSCLSAACRCPATEIECAVPGTGLVCVSYENDPANCGGCGVECAATESCIDGDCVCGDDYDVCGQSCVDLETSEYHCGECDRLCNNAECVAGDCVCPNGGVDCGTASLPACFDTQTDEAHCGGCNNTCLVSSLCGAGSCDASVEWVRVISGYSATVGFGFYSQMDVDAAGNTYVAFNGQVADYKDFFGGDTLWSTRSAIVKLDAGGQLVWAKPSTIGLGSIAVVGDDVFVVATLNSLFPTASIAGEDFALQNNYAVATAVVQLDAATGTAVGSFALDHTSASSGNLGPTLRHDASNVWLAMPQKDVRLDDTTWVAPTPQHQSLIYPIGGEPVWLPGYISSFNVDANQKPVAGLALNPNVTVNYGGQDLTTGPNGDSAIVRYASNLAHDVSYLSAVGGTLPGAAIPTTFYPFDGLFWRQAPGGELHVVGQKLPVFSPLGVGRVLGDRYFVLGNTTAGMHEGRTYQYGFDTMLVLRGDGQQLELERSASILTRLNGGSYGGLDDLALVDGGTSVILTTHFDGGVTIGDTELNAGSNYRGLAVLKIKLYEP